tara:strand:+ start:273 stop:749 length:477 start_codon:yes stop_codon:yes gene_type:complete
VFLFLLGCNPTFLPQELIFSIRDVTFNAYEPAVYLISSVDTQEENVWDAHQQRFVMEHHGGSGFYGSLSLYTLTVPWDQSTLPPLGKIVDSAQIQLHQNKPASFSLSTPIIPAQEELYTLLYIQGEGTIQGDLLVYPTVWADPNKTETWNYEIQSFRY